MTKTVSHGSCPAIDVIDNSVMPGRIVADHRANLRTEVMTERTYEGNGIGARESTSREPAFSLMERAPWYILYAFHIPYCAYLALRYGGFALPTISNPGLDASGLTKESKTELFSKL